MDPETTAAPANTAAPGLLDAFDGEELIQLGQTINAYQKSKRLSDSAMLKRFPSLGSTKTYVKIVKGDLEELNAERQLTKYRTVANLIGNTAESENEREPLYEDLSPVLMLRSVFIDAMNENGDARFVLMLGDSGAGKSSSRRMLIDLYGDRIVWVEAMDVWGDSSLAFLGEILRVMGVTNPPHNKVVRFQKVRERLTERRVCLVVDEGHHLGPSCLNTIKSLINNTPGEVVVMALYSLWRKLEREAYEEVKQLTGNRLAARIQLKLDETDAQKMLARRVKWAGDPEAKNSDCERAAKLIATKAPRYGNLAFVREVAKQLNELCAGEPATFKLFSEAMDAKGGSR